MKNAEKSVVVCGAYGMGNAGDNAVLRSVVAALREFDRDTAICVMGRKPKKTARDFGVEAAGRLQIFKWLRRMKRAKLFILGGGSLLQDVTSRRSLWYYELVTILAKRCGCAVMLYGCGIGPIRRAKERLRCAYLLDNRVDAICLRDEKSARVLADWGVKNPRVILSADPAFRLNMPAAERERAIGLALRPWPGVEKKLDDIAAAARYAFEIYGLVPVFFSFAPGDEKTARAVMARLPDIPCRQYADPKNAGRMSVMLSMRLHGLIFALSGGSACAGLSYDPKVSDFCRENELPCSLLGDINESVLKSLIDRAVSEDIERLAQLREELRSAERRNAETAWELLGK